MIHQIEIQQYSDKYKDQTIKLILKIQTEEFSIPISINDQPDLQQIPQFYQAGIGNFWIALDGQQVVGTIALFDIGNNQAALKKMFVDNSYRGKGVSKALLDTLINWCIKKEVREIYLGTISACLAAHRFYEKNGFQEILKEQLPPTFPILKVDSKFYKFTI